MSDEVQAAAETVLSVPPTGAAWAAEPGRLIPAAIKVARAHLDAHPEPNPAHEEVAKKFRAGQASEIEGTRESVERCARMLDTYAPELYPANDKGQVAFARAMMESAADEIRAFVQRPIDMVLHCPRCGRQHVDAPEPEKGWTNPPHRSHQCHGCGTVWRPADVPTTGVAAVATRGKADTWPGDGGEPVTAEWWVSVGAREVNTHPRLPRELIVGDVSGAHLAYFPDDDAPRWVYQDAEEDRTFVPEPRTRDDVVRLCAALGIALKEPA